MKLPDVTVCGKVSTELGTFNLDPPPMYTVFNKAKSPDENGALASAHWRAATNNATWNEVTPNSGLVNAPSWLATRCLQLKLSESTNVFKAGMSSGMLVFIDITSEKPLRRYGTYLDLSPASSSQEDSARGKCPTYF